MSYKRQGVPPEFEDNRKITTNDNHKNHTEYAKMEMGSRTVDKTTPTVLLSIVPRSRR
jgi:hypothetical protein